jgi:hypothetical protein
MSDNVDESGLARMEFVQRLKATDMPSSGRWAG